MRDGIRKCIYLCCFIYKIISDYKILCWVKDPIFSNSWGDIYKINLPFKAGETENKKEETKTVFIQIPQRELEKEYEKLIPCQFASFGGHEQYFYPDYFAYQENHGKKLLKACEIMNKAGFEFKFADDIVFER